jgi:hypothetical protein
MIKKMTDDEIEAFKIKQILVGAVGQNAIICIVCGSIEHFPNNETFTDCTFNVKCDKCKNNNSWG